MQVHPTGNALLWGLSCSAFVVAGYLALPAIEGPTETQLPTQRIRSHFMPVTDLYLSVAVFSM